ncbi:NAD(P)H-hydrate epimerase [Microbacterium sp. zg.B48]|uniref:NAD(P)H-hydrate epimerase n=1 Tax=unclassified Microbacterium TaxID=2609290 RepID=UPI00214BACE3|nr:MULTISPECIES: NAD(P)H-hydrate epimerase [unclassified Microbacterium]MCR2763401.1 NAD(P)H-hydrate epimerase [Microbacterium sp. zg.B48]MCR2809122.1 NAD(P)H-hydrate epimerase [Microbacterium sp. zg.B185]WIM20275.1 NAD(P)H-hydrate epimerase [Microbacterium sp. zg-B185]
MADRAPASRVPTYTAAQVRAAEKPLLEAGEPLMRRAATALAALVAEELGGAGGRVLVLAGSGDNGGDALFAAAEVADAPGVAVDVLLTSARVHESALGAAVAAGARRVDLPEVLAAASDYDVVLDGILGIGASTDPALRGTARTVVEGLLPAVRAGGPRVIAVDLPSGLQPDDGSSDGVVLPASITVTFGAVKSGLTVGSGPERAGAILLVDLGLTPALSDAEPAGSASVAAVIPG